jgi:hypothetical protein
MACLLRDLADKSSDESDVARDAKIAGALHAQTWVTISCTVSGDIVFVPYAIGPFTNRAPNPLGAAPSRILMELTSLRILLDLTASQLDRKGEHDPLG